jgi:hypothetical protein
MVDFMVSRLRNGWRILQQAFALMAQHRAFYWFAALHMVGGGLLIFTVLYALLSRFLKHFSLVASTEISTPQGFKHVDYYEFTGNNPELAMLSLFGIFFLGMLLPVILECIITLYAMAMLHKKNISTGQLILASFKNLIRVSCWVIFNLTVGLLIRSIAGNRQDRGFSIISFVREILGWLLATAWSITTFLVPQVIALESQNVFGSIKTSFNMMKKTFGESIAANFIFGIFTGACWLAVMGIVYVSISMHVAYASMQFPLFTMLLCLPFIYLASLISVAKIIFKTSVYSYAKDNDIVGFERPLIENSFK